MFGIKNPRMFTTLEKGFSDTTTAKLISCSSTVTMVLWKTGILYVSKCFTAVMLVSTLWLQLMLLDMKYLLTISITLPRLDISILKCKQCLYNVFLMKDFQLINQWRCSEIKTSLLSLLSIIPSPDTFPSVTDISCLMQATIVTALMCFWMSHIKLT